MKCLSKCFTPPLFKIMFLFSYRFVEFFIYSGYPVLDIWIANFFSHWVLCFHSLNGVLMSRSSQWNPVHQLFPLWFVLLMSYFRSHSRSLRAWRYFPRLSSGSFSVLLFHFMSVLLLELSFVTGVLQVKGHLFFRVDIQVTQHHSEKTILSPLSCSGFIIRNLRTVHTGLCF